MDVLVIVLSGSVHVGLARASMRERWTVLALGTAVEAMREVRDRSPRLVVVQVSLLSGESIKLIRMLRHCSQPVLIVAVANSHRSQLEQLVRDAGASCYLPSVEQEDQLIQAVASMLDCVPSHAATGTMIEPLVRLDPPSRLLRRGKKGAHR
jgi:DNA-binding NarL/FixJ family response regulator